MVSEFHGLVIALMAAVSDFAHHVEALYLHSRPGVDITIADG
jgi:hypothetical protein